MKLNLIFLVAVAALALTIGHFSTAPNYQAPQTIPRGDSWNHAFNFSPSPTAQVVPALRVFHADPSREAMIEFIMNHYNLSQYVAEIQYDGNPKGFLFVYNQSHNLN
jgi:hypothetical protein